MEINVDNSLTVANLGFTMGTDRLTALPNFSPRGTFTVEDVHLVNLTDQTIPSEQWIDLAVQCKAQPLGIHDAQALQAANWPVPENWKTRGGAFSTAPVFIVFAGELVWRQKEVKKKRVEPHEVLNKTTGKKEMRNVEVEVAELISVPHVPIFFTVPWKSGTENVPLCSLYAAGNGFGHLGGKEMFLAVLPAPEEKKPPQKPQ